MFVWVLPVAITHWPAGDRGHGCCRAEESHSLVCSLRSSWQQPPGPPQSVVVEYLPGKTEQQADTVSSNVGAHTGDIESNSCYCIDHKTENKTITPRDHIAGKIHPHKYSKINTTDCVCSNNCSWLLLLFPSLSSLWAYSDVGPQGTVPETSRSSSVYICLRLLRNTLIHSLTKEAKEVL